MAVTWPLKLERIKSPQSRVAAYSRALELAFQNKLVQGVVKVVEQLSGWYSSELSLPTHKTNEDRNTVPADMPLA